MYSKIIVPVMLDQEHDPSRSFQAAKALATDGADIIVLHVMEAIPSYIASEIPEGALNKTRADTEQALAALAADVPGAKPTLIAGHAGRTILDYAETQGADCIIIASHKPGIQDYFLGSTAARVVRHAQCAVHVIR